MARLTTLMMLVALTGCGYQLKSSQNTAAFGLSCNAIQSRTLCAELLSAQSPNTSEASKLLKVSIKEPKCRSRVISLRPDASSAEQNMTCSAIVILSGQNLNQSYEEQVSRTFINNENSVLAKERESGALREALWQSLASRIVERINRVHAEMHIE